MMDWIFESASEVPVTGRYFRIVPSKDQLLCRNCPQNVRQIVRSDAIIENQQRPWYATFVCGKCSGKFYFCRLCDPKTCIIISKGRSRHMTNDGHLTRHEGRDSHIANRNEFAPGEPSTFMDVEQGILQDDDSFNVSENAVSGTDEQVLPSSFSRNVSDWKKEDLFPGHNNAIFFIRQATYPGLGFKKLGSKVIHNDETQEVPLLTTLHLFVMSKLCVSLAKSQAHMFAMSVGYAIESLELPNGDIPRVPMPTSIDEMEAMFGAKSKHSVQNCIPAMKLHQRGKYFVALPSDCVREALAFGIAEIFHPGDAIMQSKSPRGLACIKHAETKSRFGGDAKLLHLSLWEDGFDPSNVKGNRVNAFVQILTVGPKDSLIHTTRNTFVICLGPSGEDRTAAQRLIAEDLAMLEAGIYCYHKATKSVEPTVALVYSVQADSPAKVSALWLLAGNSPMHSRFEYVGDISEIVQQLVSCPCCWQARKDGRMPPDNCTQCHDWSFEKLTYKTPDGYPRNGHDEKVGAFLNFKRITVSTATKAVDKITINVRSGIWTSRVKTRCYGRTEGLSPALVDKIFDFALATAGKNDKFPCPPSWHYPNVCFRQWLPVPMHLLFLGITKATLGEFVVDWLTTHKLKSSYLAFVSSRLMQLNSLHLTWLKSVKLSNDGGFGKFVSENYLSLAKVCKWLYGSMGNMFTLDREYSDPKDKSIGRYNTSELREWLKARKLAYPPKASKEELYQLCMTAITVNDGKFPPILPTTSQNSSLEEVECLVSALHAMLSRVMIRGAVEPSDAQEADRHIKHFLSSVAGFVANTAIPSGSKRLPEFITKYNFINLLSVPEAMQECYSLRNVWEGDGKGEGAIPFIKQDCILSVEGENWPKNGFVNYVRKRGVNKCMAELIHDLDDMNFDHKRKDFAASLIAKDLHSHRPMVNEGDDDVVDHHSTTGRKDHEKHFRRDDFLQRFESSDMVLSVVMTPDSSVWAVCRDGRHVQLERSTGPTNMVLTCGAAYFRWSIKEPSPLTLASIGSKCENCVLLPHHSSSDYRHFYYLVTSDWKEMLVDGSIGRPRAIGVAYL